MEEGNIKGNEIQLHRFMEGSEKRFIIPVYQRNYDWKIVNCRQLFDDLLKIKEDNRKSHFFGSIVSALPEDQSREEYLIIDGQQRLTSISLLLLAMYDLIDQGLIEVKDNTLKQRIREEYLNKYSPSDKKIKLKPIKNDQNAFNNLVDNNNPIESSNITTNYKYFYNRILEEVVSVDDLFDAFQKLIIIGISLNSEENPQLIFESLNSTSLELSEGDKIRNFILMDVRPISL